MQPRFEALMVDVDGVLVAAPDGRRWDAELARDLGIEPEDLQREFFAHHWDDVATGRATVEERLGPVLARIAPGVGAEELLAHWFADDAANLDTVLLGDLDDLRRDGVPLHLATVQEHRRAEHLWSVVGLGRHFDGLHHSAAVGAAKPDPAYFRATALRVGLAPDVLLLLDDDERNVAAARAAGWQAVHWTGQHRLGEVLAEHAAGGPGAGQPAR